MKHLPFTRSIDIVADMPRQPGSKFQNVGSLMLASEVLQGIYELGNRAAAGEVDAAELLHGMAGHATNELAAVVREKPKILASAILKCVQWPMLVSLNPENEKANRSFLRAIRLGEKAEVTAHPGARWDRNNPAIVWANDTIETIRSNQRRAAWPTTDLTTWPKWAVDCAKLPPLSKATAKQWWAIGKQAMLERFPKPEEMRELSKLVPYESEPSRKRAKVLFLIGRALQSMASK